MQQVNGEFVSKEVTFIASQTAVQKLIKSFFSIQFEHVPRAQTTMQMRQATLMSIPSEVVDVRVIKKNLRATIEELIYVVSIGEQDWCTPISQNLTQASSSMIEGIESLP